jgi:hypothetical protein
MAKRIGGGDQQSPDAILQGLMALIPFACCLEIVITKGVDFKDYLSMNDRDGEASSDTSSTVPSLAQQMCFFNTDDQKDSLTKEQIQNGAKHAVLISSTAKSMSPQFALMGKLRTQESVVIQDPRIMLNTNVPFSAFVCGVQGSGKSHTTSCVIGKNGDQSEA